MSLEDPRTPIEWEKYFDLYSAEEVLSKAKASNNQSFVRSLVEEGYSMKEIENIFLMMAIRIDKGNFKPPVGSAYDLNLLLKRHKSRNLDIPTLEELKEEP